MKHHRCLKEAIFVHKQIIPLDQERRLADPLWSVHCGYIAPPVGMIQPGQVFTVIREINHKWVQVIAGDVAGYVYGSLLNRTAELEDYEP